MAKYGRTKQFAGEIEMVDTSVWACANQGCKCWIREDYSFAENPLCPICESSMVREVRSLPEIQG
ncbi:cold-inducible protein YdjO-related protein [Cohnella terricola]|uniref:Cold-shock protein n=1 Tax=Cohnella terricola TaxID=1289167 RepID=A0A559JWT3_9BACL|nr:cold-inducible protein YdjO-related protein [Cohnella terricola]TVY04353.1 cold-shock protein [Cohnella terricola]